MITKEETTELLQKLVSIDSQYFSEHDIMSFAQKWLNENGLEGKIYQYSEEKVTGFNGENVILEVDGGKDGPVICLNGHLDTVHMSNGWTKNPYGELNGDKLYGMGTLDMKSGCAALMIALKEFTSKYKIFKGKIKLTLVSVEEGPFGLGTNAIIEDGYLDDVDFSIVTEPSAGFTGKPFPDLCLGARGGYGINIEFYGKAAHAASPEKGNSALIDAAKVVKELENIEYIEDPFLGKGTCSVVALNSDGGACSIPDFANMKLFWHIVVGENPDTITAEIEKAIKRAEIKSEYKIKFREAPSEDSKGFMPYTIDENNHMVQSFIKSIENVVNKKPSISYFNSIGDFCYLGTRLNAPVVIFGAEGKNYHSKDEYVLLETVYDTANVVYDFMEKILI